MVRGFIIKAPPQGLFSALARFSEIVRKVDRDIRGRLLVFFPGQYEHNNYRLLDARDGWNYLAIPLTHYSDEFTP